MGVFEALLEKLERIEKTLEELKAADSGKSDDDCFISPKEAGLIYGCTAEFIRQRQDRGLLTLYTLPGSKERRVLKSELLALIEKNAQRLPIVKKKQ